MKKELLQPGRQPGKPLLGIQAKTAKPLVGICPKKAQTYCGCHRQRLRPTSSLETTKNGWASCGVLR